MSAFFSFLFSFFLFFCHPVCLFRVGLCLYFPAAARFCYLVLSTLFFDAFLQDFPSHLHPSSTTSGLGPKIISCRRGTNDKFLLFARGHSPYLK